MAGVFRISLLRQRLLGRIKRRWLADPDATVALTLRVVREYLPCYWRRYGLVIALDGLAAGCTGLMAYLVSHVVDQVYAYHNFAIVVAISVLFFAVMTAKGLALYGQAVVLARLGNAILAENQRQIFTKLLHQGLGFFADRHSAEFAAQIAYAAGAPAGILGLLVTTLASDGLTVIALLTVMLVQNPAITLVAILTMPVTAVLVRDVVRRIRELASRQYDFRTGILESVQETVLGLRTIKAFTLEEAVQQRAEQLTKGSRQTADKLAGLMNQSTPITEALGGFAVALLTIYASYRVMYGNMMPGSLASFLAAFLLAYDPVKRLARLNIHLTNGLFGVRTLYHLLDSPPTEPEDLDKPSLTLDSGQIEFSAVNFAYRPGSPVLRDMTFIADAGRVTALVGPSGGGKSTIVSLILRLYEVDSGKITIDRQEIGGVSRESLRRQVAYVGQDVFLFRGTVRENIAFGKPDATEQEIVAAATAAHAHDFIVSLPNGYASPVGEHGLQLSTGQRQRLSIARALLKDAPVIMLDEPTAALDSESEHYIQSAIAHLCRNRTTIVIAHRLRTIMHADRILFVEHGRVVESGSHWELLHHGGRYAAYYRLQFEDDQSKQKITPPRVVRGL